MASSRHFWTAALMALQVRVAPLSVSTSVDWASRILVFMGSTATPPMLSVSTDASIWMSVMAVPLTVTSTFTGPFMPRDSAV